jgi:raffinose/stachyose/melibiose transport system permease protein
MERNLKKYFPVFVLPMLAAFIIGFIIPFVEGIYLSFSQFTTVRDATFIGAGNYSRAIQDSSFISWFAPGAFKDGIIAAFKSLMTSSFWFTAFFAVIATVLINVLAFFVASMLTKKFRGTTIFRSVFFMPNLIGGIVLGYTWQTLINGILVAVGKPLLAVNATAGFWGLIVLMLWQQIGYMMIIYIAGLQNVPSVLLEAAHIDGATPWQSLWKVKIPMLMPSITICLFLSITNSFKLFDQNLALTMGEPAHSTEMLALNIYNTFYFRVGPQWKGLGQAKSVIFFVLVVLLSLIQLRATRSKEVQQ